MTADTQARHIRTTRHAGSTLAALALAIAAGPATAAANGAPQLAFTEPETQFGTVDTGSSGALYHATLTNTSPTATATGLHFDSGPDFPLMSMFSSCQGGSLKPGGQCQVHLKFAPSQPGPAAGTLVVTSTEGAQAAMALSGIGGDDAVLYGQFHDWDTQPAFSSLLNARFLSTPAYSADLADDFLVENAAGWTLTKVGLEVFSFRSPNLLSVDVHVLPDDGGVPGDDAVCSALDATIALLETPFWESRIEIALPTPCTLPIGHYWLRVVMTVNNISNDFLGWGLQYVNNESAADGAGAPPIHLHPPVWRQPGGGSGYPGCFVWTPLDPPTCGLEDWAPFQTLYGTVFWLIGRAVGDEIFADGFESPPR